MRAGRERERKSWKRLHQVPKVRAIDRPPPHKQPRSVWLLPPLVAHPLPLPPLQLLLVSLLLLLCLLQPK